MSRVLRVRQANLDRVAMHKMSGKDFRNQLLRGALIGFLLFLTILGWSVIGVHFFGYRFFTAHGGSMEPALQDGDIIWVKYIDVTKVKVGDMVTLQHPDKGSITHRVIEVKPLFRQRYLLVTKGDANRLTEAWEISADETVAVSVACTPLAGYVVDFLGRPLGRGLCITAIIIVMLIWVRQRRMAHGGG